MKVILTLCMLLFMTSSFCQKRNEKLEYLLDTIKSVDFKLTPNTVIKKNLIGKNIIWSGKIDTIEITTRDEQIQMVFYYTHYQFKKITKNLILLRKIELKNYGDGNFTVSLLSKNMTKESAQEIIKKLMITPSTYILTIGKVEGLENKFKKTFINTQTFNFYTFHL
jgi:hypothetical protein